MTKLALQIAYKQTIALIWHRVLVVKTTNRPDDSVEVPPTFILNAKGDDSPATMR